MLLCNNNSARYRQQARGQRQTIRIQRRTCSPLHLRVRAFAVSHRFRRVFAVKAVLDARIPVFVCSRLRQRNIIFVGVGGLGVHAKDWPACKLCMYAYVCVCMYVNLSMCVCVVLVCVYVWCVSACSSARVFVRARLLSRYRARLLFAVVAVVVVCLCCCCRSVVAVMLTAVCVFM